MKKQLLVGAIMLASFFTAQAQAPVSFETSEGFTIGELQPEGGAGQNGWGANSPFVEITNTDASEGTNSLLIGTNNTPLENGAQAGAFSPVAVIAGDVEFSFDIKISAFPGEGGTSFIIAPQTNAQNKATARIGFFPDGQIAVVKAGEDGVLDWFLYGTVEGEEFVPFVPTAGTWYNFKTLLKFSEGVIEYYIDDVLLQASTVWAGTAVDNSVFLCDNLSSTALIDNVVTKPLGTAGVNENLISKLSVFPNPANDVVNVTNNENILVNGVEVVDLNGRTVKTAKFDGVANAQINVADLASGIYMMTVSSDKGTMTKKIVKN